MSEGDLTIHQAIAEIINELGGIGKTGLNKEQGYNFRGIDAVLQHLHPLFAKYGIFFAPCFDHLTAEGVVAKSGAQGQRVRVQGTYFVYGPTGDSISLTTYGEGLDYSDKATNKAMTAAFKYALFQLFAICDPLEDGDSEGPEDVVQDEDLGPLTNLIDLLVNSGFNKAIQHDVIAAAIGHGVRELGDLSAEEITLATTAIESAIVDRDQLQEEKS